MIRTMLICVGLCFALAGCGLLGGNTPAGEPAGSSASPLPTGANPVLSGVEATREAQALEARRKEDAEAPRQLGGDGGCGSGGWLSWGKGRRRRGMSWATRSLRKRVRVRAVGRMLGTLGGTGPGTGISLRRRFTRGTSTPTCSR